MQALKNTPDVQVLVLDTYNGTRAQAESYRQITGITAPMLRDATNGLDYAGARLEDIVLVDQDGNVQYAINATTTHLMSVVVDRAFSLINKTPLIRLVQRELYFGQRLQVGQTVTIPLQIENTGAGPLEITGYETSVQGLQMAPVSLTVGPNEKKEFQVTFTPQQEGVLTGTLTLTHASESVGSLQVSIRELTIEGVAPADPRADFDGNGRVEFSDFLAFARGFKISDLAFDLDGNGRVEFGDFLVFARSFGKSVN